VGMEDVGGQNEKQRTETGFKFRENMDSTHPQENYTIEEWLPGKQSKKSAEWY